jgi:hypothetical protein
METAIVGSQDTKGMKKNNGKPDCLKISHKEIWLNRWMKNNEKNGIR